MTTAYVHAALARARSADGVGVIDEGTVGSGTGMTTCDFAGGIGTSSRVLRREEGGDTVGVLVQSDLGRMQALRPGSIPSAP